MRPQDSRFAVHPLTLHQGVGASATLALPPKRSLWVPLFPQTCPFKLSGAAATSRRWSTLALLLHSTSSQLDQTLGFLKTLINATKGLLGHAQQQGGRVPLGRSDRLPPRAPTLRPPGAPVGPQTGEKSASPPLFSADSVSSCRQRHVLPDVPAWAQSSAWSLLVCMWFFVEMATCSKR
jgi:hypothetical protein